MGDEELCAWLKKLNVLLSFRGKVSESVGKEVNVVVIVLVALWTWKNLEAIGFAFATTAGKESDRVVLLLRNVEPLYKVFVVGTGRAQKAIREEGEKVNRAIAVVEVRE